ncbi:LysR family transcriptional regulator [Pseudomonas typographi]|uniref:LysR family transcriptional regulator n=1 Tax=Pseudomonas typographi TaxID=2715964 RepID=A0ABR7YX38_9PSED|nr:LysR family transcriptional regulator [Pseudomonas typographi]MBD1551248.1 LysR family transcriptional regulator [Pseudomonas typographi]MBD1586258.1 LysR family transcriptional regulator [Pseudomonas typographi]MBD1597730.1 LysR family transcriptional regulator [Pseudomonas typographi]
MKSLDMEAVHAFVLTANLKSFTRAAEVLDTTQSAVSLKIKRLEHNLGRRLLERTPRQVRLSADGAAFEGAARALLAAHERALAAFGRVQRRLTVALSHHLVGSELPALLQRLNAAAPALVWEVRVVSSREALQAFDAGEVEAALVLGHDAQRADGEVVMHEAFGWMALADFQWPAGEALRLATQAEPCNVRRMAVDTLDAAGIDWREVFVGGGIITLGAAVLAGLAVAALGRRVAPPGSVDVGPRLGLPSLPGRDVLLHSQVRDTPGRDGLRALCAALVGSRA